MTKRKVFILEELKNVNLANANDFGEVVYCYRQNQRNFSLWHENYEDYMLNRLEELGYDPELDILAITGHQIALIRVTNELTFQYGLISVLYWNSVDREYTLKPLGHPLEEEEEDAQTSTRSFSESDRGTLRYVHGFGSTPERNTESQSR